MTVSSLRLLVLCLGLCLALTACPGSHDSRRSSRKNAEADKVSDEAQAQINLGKALLMQGEPIKALPELLRAKELAPKNADVENYLGLAYLHGQREYELAIESFKKALAISPNRTDIHNNLGLVYLEMNNFDQALAEFNLCLKDLLYQNKHLAYTNIGLTYFKMKDYNQALASLNRALEIAPDYAVAYKQIGRIHLARQEYEPALDYLVNAARLNDKDPETFMDLGNLYVRLGKPDEAAQAYSQVAVLAPNTPMALDAQSRARKAMGF